MKTPDNIENLAEKNLDLLRKLNFTPGIDDPSELCTPEAYRQTGLFSDTAVSAIFYSPETQQRQYTSIPTYIGMILVRPDMLHASSQFEKYIKERFCLESSEKVELTAEAYWNIYKHDLYRAETLHSRLTRAAIYIGSPSRLIVFSDKERKRHSGDHLAGYMKQVLQGNQGVYSPGTLRGDIVYRNAIDLGLHLLDDSVDERIKLAADPFTAYRKLARNDTGIHAHLTYPLLFYTGIGVHVPGDLEIESDLPELQALNSAA